MKDEKVMQNEDIIQTRRAQVSALMDNHLSGEAFHAAADLASSDADALSTWHIYHLVGDVMRSPELAHGIADGAGFVARLGERLRTEPAPLRPHAQLLDTTKNTSEIVAIKHHLTLDRGQNWHKNASAANEGHYRWQMLAGFAALAVVASLGWNLLASPDGGAGAQLALRQGGAVVAGAATTLAAIPAPDVVSGSGTGGMIRDARLDELMAAHRQTGSFSALHNPAGFLRNATYQEAGR